MSKAGKDLKRNPSLKKWDKKERAAVPYSPVRHRLLVPLAAVLMLLVGGFGAVMITMQQNYMNQSSQEKLDVASDGLQDCLTRQARVLAALEEVMILDAGLSDALKARDRGRLLANYEALFTRLRAEYGITHFYFHGPDRVNLLRVYNPEKRGGRIDRFTAREAERTGKTASGIELGSLGTFTLRAVRPVFDGNILTGYLELGREIEDILTDLHEKYGVELAVSIRKSTLERKNWEAGMKLFGRDADWDRFSDDVLIYSSLPNFPSECERFIHGEKSHEHGDVHAEAVFNRKSWRVMTKPLADASGTEVGDLIVLHDISEAKAAFYRILAAASGVTLAFLAGLFGFFHALLRRIDQSIRVQQADLAENETNQRILLDNILTQVWYLTDDHTYGAVNKAHAEFNGVKTEDLAFKDMYDIFPQDVVEVCRQGNIEIFTTGKAFRTEEWAPHVSGERRLISIMKSPKLDENGEVEYVVCSADDITEHRQTKDALLRSEKKYREIFSHAVWGIFQSTPQGQFINCNPAFSRIFGYDSPGELISAISDISKQYYVYTDDRERYIQILQEKGTVDKFEFKARRKDGSEVWVTNSTRIVADHDGDILYYEGVVSDISDRKLAEEALRESEEKFSKIFHNAPLLITISNVEDGTCIEVNEEFVKVSGFTREEAIGKTSVELLRWIEPEERARLAETIRSNGRIDGMEVSLRAKCGKKIICMYSAVIITIRGRERLLSLAQNLTEYKLAEEEKARIEDQYRQAQKVEAIGRLAGGVAHDLNNLLSPILGYGEMLADDFNPGDARLESVKEIVNAGFRARDLVRQLLAFSRKQTLEYRTLDMNKIIEGFENLLRSTIREDIGIEIIPSPDIRPVRADIGQIEQVIMNLAVNAQDAMPEGGRLIMETAMAELDEEYAASRPGVQPGSYVMLAVSDTGSGMDEETRGQIFEPFFSTKGERGTGLGLATVYGIVKQHGGNIWVYSEPGKGTTFKVYLPVSEDVHVETEPLEKPARNQRGSETILLVEDSEQVRDLTHTILERQGYTILMAGNGAEALAVLASHGGHVHLLLTDVVMPGMNGKELFAKAAEKYPGLKVLYMSGYTGNVIAQCGVLDEGIAFIQKPFSVKAMAAKVREVLDSD
ncbi:PAS domain S-box protein [Desulfococcaceae bacterium HSG8]|nr:PAS domain S-box protein [Desulfococcaceae bacterium HSG8]